MRTLSKKEKVSVSEILSNLMIWSSFDLVAEAMREFERTSEPVYAGSEDGYNMSVGIQPAEAVEYDAFSGTEFIGDRIVSEKESLSVVRGFAIRGGCGYGSKIVGWMEPGKLAEISVESCGGHWINLVIWFHYGGTRVEVKCDGHPSESSWGPELKTADERSEFLWTQLRDKFAEKERK